MAPELWDVVIVGAGPAGSSLAARLGASGWSVLLLDSARFPRDKMCGEYLGAGCLPLLRDLGAGDGLLRRGYPVRLITARLPGGNEFRADYPQAAFGLSLSRRVLDSILLERARLDGSVSELSACIRDTASWRWAFTLRVCRGWGVRRDLRRALSLRDLEPPGERPGQREHRDQASRPQIVEGPLGHVV
jgi:choline dehydrogenase-like flavoprotein